MTAFVRSPISASDAARRRFLRQTLGYAGGLASGWAALPAWAQAGSPSREGRLVLVFLRGACDGLSALVPYADSAYYQLRHTIAIPPPDGSAQTCLALNDQFGLHPALAALMPLWKEGSLGMIAAAGLPGTTRSHFEAQHQWEVGLPGDTGSATGWLNTLAGQLLPASAQDASTTNPHAAPASHAVNALSVGEANPLILAGATRVQRVPRGSAATQQGALGHARTRQAVLDLYSGQDPLAQAFRSGAQSRMETAQTLSDSDALQDPGREMQAANNGAGTAPELLQDARHLSTLMNQERRLRVGFLSAGGWDTHANQGAVTGALAKNLEHLARTLVHLRQNFQQPDDVIVVCSEFGRTAAENGTRGTDHGHGNALWLIGNRVRGGRIHGTWTGLARANLNEGRDLPVHHDFRGVMAQVLRAAHGLSNAQLEALFPGFTWDAKLDGLLQA